MPTFSAPHALKLDEKQGMQVVDHENSEEFRLLEALGTPRVFYALLANKYFKDPKSEKEFSDEEITKLGLPIPAEIESKRRKRIKEANDAGVSISALALARELAPKEILPPEHIREKLISVSPLDRMINRINKSTVGK